MIQLNFALGLSLGSFIGLIAVLITVGRYKERFDQMWDVHQKRFFALVEMQMRLGVNEAKQKGIMKNNSPLRLTPEAVEALSPIGPQLRDLYLEKKWPVNDPEKWELPTVEQFLEVWNRFGHEIMDIICDPFGLNQGACLIAAIEYGRQLAAKHQQAA